MSTPTEQDKKQMKARVKARQLQIEAWFDKLYRQIDAGVIGGEPGRKWMDKWAVGNGLNIACGDFPIGESLGVDPAPRKIAADMWTQGDALVMDEAELDFIVTNYFECFPNPMKVLQDWNQLLKPGGVVALVLGDADEYSNPRGPLGNKRKFSCFTFRSLGCYLARAGFEVVDWEKDGTELRVAARKL